MWLIVQNKILNIFDARPYLNALANCTTGGGYENEKYYTTSKIQFLNIEKLLKFFFTH